MAHWSERYVGRPYVEGEFDCGELARLVQREVFHREVHIPTERTYVGERHPVARARAMAGEIAAALPACAARTDLPRDGDGVLLMARGWLRHIGVYCWIGTEPWVLHADDAVGQVVLTRLRELGARGLKVEGFYTFLS